MTANAKKLLIGYVCGVSAAIFWGFHAVAIRWLIHDGVNPLLLGDLRLLIGSGGLAIATMAFAIFNRRPIFAAVSYSKFFWIIAGSLAVNFFFFHKGLEFTTGSNAILLETFSSVIILVLIMIFIPQRMEHMLRTHGLAQRVLKIIILGSIGSALLLLNEPKDIFLSSDKKTLGDILESIAMLAWALVLLGMHEYQKREAPHDIIVVTSRFLFVAALILAPFVPWWEISNITDMQWMWIVILGFFSTGIAYILCHIASRNLDIVPLVTIFSLTGLFNVITESVFLNLEIGWKLYIGGILILYAATMAKILNEKHLKNV